MSKDLNGWLCGSTASVIMALSALAQGGLPFTILPPKGASDEFSSSVAAGDIDGDGFDDVFVMDPGFERDVVRYGRWHLYSGRTGALLWTGEATEPTDAPYSYFVAAFVPDLNNDGWKEILLGRPYFNEYRGGVDLLSGRDGQVLFSERGVNPGDYMGRDVANVGDVTGDGVDDFAYVSVHWEQGLVIVRSGVTGAMHGTVLRSWPRRIRGAGDIDGDSFHDVAVGSWGGGYNGQGLGVYSGRTGEVLLNILPDDSQRDLGYAVAAGRDVTGDGVPDLALTESTTGGTVVVYSGRGGGVVTTIVSNASDGLYGYFLSFGDIDGDGYFELIVGGSERMHAFDALSGERLHWVYSGEGNGRPVVFGNEFAVGDVNADGAVDLIIGRDQEAVECYGGGTMLLNYEGLTGRRKYHVNPGEMLELAVRGSSPGRRIQLLGSRAGNLCTFVPRLGICIDLNQPIQRVAEAIVGLDGIAPFEVTVPADALLGLAWIQAVDPDHYWLGPITSNVMRFEVVE